MKYPLVSICIPTHNRLSFFKKALKSARQQTYNNIEIVISDNSDDNKTQQYITTLKDSRIRYYRIEPNFDPFLNVSQLVELAHGVYIKYVMDDDLLQPNCVDRMVKIFGKYSKVGVVMAPLNIIDKKGKNIQPTFYFVKKMKYLYKYANTDLYVNKEKIMNDFLTKIYPCCVPTGVMFRKSLFNTVKGFDKQFRYIGDVDLCMNFATKMDFYYINEFLSSWRFSQLSETVSIVHKKGIESDIFYRLLDKYSQYSASSRKSYFFASKRTSLNILAGIQSRNPALVLETLKTIMHNDPYILNLMLLPFNLLFEVIKSLFHL